MILSQPERVLGDPRLDHRTLILRSQRWASRALLAAASKSGILPAFTIVGLPVKAIAESREWVHSALGAMGLGLPPKRFLRASLSVPG
jgi:hypothetical protein